MGLRLPLAIPSQKPLIHLLMHRKKIIQSTLKLKTNWKTAAASPWFHFA